MIQPLYDIGVRIDGKVNVWKLLGGRYVIVRVVKNQDEASAYIARKGGLCST